MEDAIKFFLARIDKDTQFQKKAKSCATDSEKMAFLRQEGFQLTWKEFESALMFWPTPKPGPNQESKERRKATRYDVFAKITKINGLPINDTTMLDISASGAKIESTVPFRDKMELSFSLPGCEEEGETHRAAKVMWWGQVSFSNRYQTGLKFYEPLERYQGEDQKGPRKHLRVVTCNHATSQKGLLTIREFADTVGVHWFTVWRWTVEKQIKVNQDRAGCNTLIPTSELSKFQ